MKQLNNQSRLVKDIDNVGGNNSGDGGDGCDVGGGIGDDCGDIGDVGDVGDIGDVGDVGDHQSPAELERLHPPVPVQTVLLPLVGSMTALPKA